MTLARGSDTMKKRLIIIAASVLALLGLNCGLGVAIYNVPDLLQTVIARNRISSGHDEPVKIYTPFMEVEVYIAPSGYTAEDFAKDYGYEIEKDKKKGFKDHIVKDGTEYSIILDFDDDVSYLYIKKV